MILILPKQINALEVNGGLVLPDKPDDNYSDFIIYKREASEIYLVTFNADKNTYVSSSYWNGGTWLDIYPLPVCHDPYLEYTNSGICNATASGQITDFKRYVLKISDDTNHTSRYWLEVDSNGKNASFSLVSAIYYSTLDIYYRKDAARSSYPETINDVPTYFITGSHYVDKSLIGLDSSYADMTYKHNYSLIWEVNEFKRYTETNESYITYTIDLDFSLIIDENSKVQVDFGEASNNYILPVTVKKPKITILNPYYSDVNINVLDKDNNVIFKTTIGQATFIKNSLDFLPVVSLEYGMNLDKDTIVYRFNYLRFYDMNNLYILPNVDSSTLDDSFKFSSSYSINGETINKPNYVLEINKNNFDDYPELNIVINFKDIPSYNNTIVISSYYDSYEDYYGIVYDNYINSINNIVDNDSFFEGLTKAFEHFKDKIKIILQDLDYFFNSLSNDFKYYFYIIFAIGLFGIFLKFIL